MYQHLARSPVLDIWIKTVIKKVYVQEIIDLINRQQEEIEQLKFETAKLLPKDCPCAIQIEVSNKLEAQIKSEAIKEFAEKLKSLVNQHHYMLDNIHNSRDFGMFTMGFEQAIDNIVKEMVGDNSNE